MTLHEYADSMQMIPCCALHCGPLEVISNDGDGWCDSGQHFVSPEGPYWCQAPTVDIPDGLGFLITVRHCPWCNGSRPAMQADDFGHRCCACSTYTDYTDRGKAGE